MAEIIFIFPAFYAALLLVYLRGWLKIPELKISEPKEFPKFSIIVPARNEEDHIKTTLSDLLLQNYPSDSYEIIFVDDHSTDHTLSVLENELSKINQDQPAIHVIKLEDEPGITAFKKRAIEAGINLAQNDWIVLTDADCRRNYNWLISFAEITGKSNPDFISAPVSFHNESSFFQKMQSVEFASLIGIGGACIGNNFPTLCNGANMAFKKEAFYQVEGYAGNTTMASGDDEFLMHKMKPEKVVFLKNREAFVFTKPKNTLDEFLQQRKRWVSKSTGYKNPAETMMIWLVWLFHLSILLSAGFAFFSKFWFLYFLVSAMTKFVFEFIFILPVIHFFQRQKLLWFYLPSAILYIPYVVLIAFAGLKKGYIWKGRKVR